MQSNEVGLLLEDASSRQLLQVFDTRFKNYVYNKATEREVHKKSSENIMISLARQVTDEVFEAEFLLDDRNELMSDHVTGNHIQGMVLVEAARQMFLAVTQQFFIDEDKQQSYYFVINSIDTAFHRFVFPLETLIHYTILEKDLSDTERLTFSTCVRIMQAEQCAATIKIKFTAFDATKLLQKEAHLAREAVASCLEKKVAASHSEVE